jgi:chromosome partitioning protein
MRTIALANQKGGVGKTTLAVNLAVGFARVIGDTVLLIDLDAQANATFSLLGPQEFEPSAYDVLVGETPVRDAIRNAEKRLDVLPSTLDLAAAEVELLSTIGAQSRLRSRLAESKLDYDTIIIDCPPSLGLLTINALAASDSVIVPVMPSAYSIKGLRELSKTVEKVRRNLGGRCEVAGIVINMENERTRVSVDVRAALNKEFPKLVYKTGIPRSIQFEESNARAGRPILSHAPSGKGAAAILSLLKEVTRDN